MRSKVMAALGIVLVSGMIAFAQQRGEIVAISQVPKAVREGADKATEDVKWVVSFKFVEEKTKRTWYRLAGRETTQKNRLVTVMVFENGEIRDVRVQILASEVPAVVDAAVKKAFPNFTQPKMAEAVGKTMKTTIYYRFEGDMNGSKCAITAKTDGTHVLQEGK